MENTFTVTVETETEEQAEIVMRERIGFDEDYGFDYEIDFTSEKPKPTVNKIKVSNMSSSKTNRAVCNQFEITTPDGIYFQSYKSIIAFKRIDGKIFLDRETWNYSNTTSRYRCQFLNERGKETQKKIDAGIYTLTDLN